MSFFRKFMESVICIYQDKEEAGHIRFTSYFILGTLIFF